MAKKSSKSHNKAKHSKKNTKVNAGNKQTSFKTGNDSRNIKPAEKANGNVRTTKYSGKVNNNTKITKNIENINTNIRPTKPFENTNNNLKNAKPFEKSNSNTRNTTSLNRTNGSTRNINRTGTRDKTNVTSLRPQPSSVKQGTYRPRNRSTTNTTISAKRYSQKSNRDWGLIFARLGIQVTLGILFYFVVYVIVTDYAGEAYDFAYQIFGDVCVDSSSKKKVKVTIPEDASLKEIASLLADKELIKNEYSFYIRGKLSTNDKRQIIPGTYVLYASDNYEDILNILTKSDNLE